MDRVVSAYKEWKREGGMDYGEMRAELLNFDVDLLPPMSIEEATVWLRLSFEELVRQREKVVELENTLLLVPPLLKQVRGLANDIFGGPSSLTESIDFLMSEIDAVAEVQEGKRCRWWPRHHYYRDLWKAECGLFVRIEEESPGKGEFLYCPKCGGRIVEMRYTDEAPL